MGYRHEDGHRHANTCKDNVEAERERHSATRGEEILHRENNMKKNRLWLILRLRVIGRQKKGLDLLYDL